MFNRIATSVLIAALCSSTLAMRTEFIGSTPLDSRMDQSFPAGSIALANLPERTEYDIGPPFGSGLYTFKFETENVGKLNEALKNFSKIAANKREVLFTSRPCEVCTETKDQAPVSSSTLHYTFTVWQTSKYKEMREISRGTEALEKEYPAEAPPPPLFTIYLDHVTSETMSKVVIPGNVEVRKN